MLIEDLNKAKELDPNRTYNMNAVIKEIKKLHTLK